jgi:hypothetical protein
MKPSMAHENSADGLSTIGEIKTGSYIWFVGALILSGVMVYNFARIDSGLYASKNKFVDPAIHRENRLSSTSIPNTHRDSRGNVGFSDVAEGLGK